MIKTKRFPVIACLLAGGLWIVACAPAATTAPTIPATLSPPPSAAPAEPTAIPLTQAPPTPTAGVEPSPPAGFLDATYEIDGQSVMLVNGLSEVQAVPGSASRITTQYFGNEAFADLNADGLEDVVFLLTQTGGGSGTFFYAVVALRTASGYQGTNAVLLGDRVAPQSTNIEDGTIVVNYADRKPGESFAVAPSVGVSKYLQVVEGRLVEVSQP